RDLEVTRATLGERERRLRHPAQLETLLRARGRDGGPEVLPRAVGVHPLRGARAEDGLGGRLVARLGLELLVGAGLEPLHRAERRLLLDADLSLLRHGPGILRPP